MSFLEDLCLKLYTISLLSFFAIGINNSLGNYSFFDYAIAGTILISSSIILSYFENKRRNEKKNNL
ncbi:MAG: hypothetical protein QXM96_03475 [Candidatus Woesearchaeota archaeon]